MKRQLLTICAGIGLLCGGYGSDAAPGRAVKAPPHSQKNKHPVAAVQAKTQPPISSPAKTLLTGSAGTFTRAITARGPISLSGALANSPLVVDAYDSGVGPYDSVTNRIAAGDVGTASTANGAITLNLADVCGMAGTGPGGKIALQKSAIGDLNWCATSTGIEPGWTNANMSFTPGTNAPPSGVPTIPLTATSVSGSNIIFLSVDSSTAIYRASSFMTGGSSEPLIVTGHSTLYVTGDFKIQGGGYVYIAPGASLTLYVGGQATIAGNGFVNADAEPARFNLIGLAGNTTVKYGGTSAFYGTINAPQADVTASGGAETFGAIICNTFTASGEANVHYDIRLAQPVITAPPDLVLECPADTSTNRTGMATARGGCSDLAISCTDTVTPGCGGAEVIARAWIATDNCGGNAVAVQTITVRDTTPPLVSAPADVVLPFTGDTSTSTAGVATAQDGCSSVALSYADAAAAQPNGSILVARTWTATDACGNFAAAVQNITLSAPLPLVLPSLGDLSVADLQPLVVTNTAANPNGNTGALTYQLLNAPPGAAIDANGVISWTPTLAQSPSTNLFTTVATTTIVSPYGNRVLSATNSFAVVVSGPYDNLDMLVDSDGDGLTNLVEYAVGGDPHNSADGNEDLVIFLTQDSGNQYLTMRFKHRTNAAALQLQYLPEVSADKISWESDATHVLGLGVMPLDSAFDWVTVRDTTPVTAAAARFIRLHVISAGQESASPVWIGSDTLLQANHLTFFSQRMVRPVVSAGAVAGVTAAAVTVNGPVNDNQFGTNGTPGYLEFDNGAMVDIIDISAPTVSLAADAAALCSPGTPYRIRPHFTVASLFGTNNETGLMAGGNPLQADNILIFLPESQSMLTVFYYSNPSYTTWQGWVRADTFTPAADLVVYPEQGLMVKRIADTDANLYLCGPVKTGPTLAPVQPGNNLMGTLKSLSSLPLSALNLYTGDPATGFAAGQKPRDGDNLLVVNPDGSLATYFYYYQAGVYSGWVNANGFTLANDVQIPAGSAFYIKRQAPGSFSWSIPAE